MAINDPLVMPMAVELLDCLETELALTEDPPFFIGLRPGSVVDHLLSTESDECCQGLGWVRPVTFYPTSGPFPAQDAVPLKSGPLGWSVVLEMGVVRCAPTPDANAIPTNAQWFDVVQKVMDDAAAMRRAICCYIDADPTRRKLRVMPGAWTPLSVEGGCVGGVLPMTILGPACDCVESS